MEPPRLLIDTSIIVEHLRKQNRRKSILYNVASSYSLCTSTIVEFELYAGATDEQKRGDILAILNWCHLLPFTSEVAGVAATIYRNLRTANRVIEIRDMFIAATALAYDLPLMTLNVKHFERIEHLQVRSPLN